MHIELVTPPTEEDILELVSISDMRRELRITSANQDEAIRDKILEAYHWLSGPGGVLNRCILATELTVYLEAPFTEFQPPYPPWLALLGVEFWHPDGYWENVANGNFIQPPVWSDIHLRAEHGYVWPELGEEHFRVRVAYMSGFMQPADAKQRMRNAITCMKLMAAHLFHNREATVMLDRNVQSIMKLPYGLQTFVTRLRVPNDHS